MVVRIETTVTYGYKDEKNIIKYHLDTQYQFDDFTSNIRLRRGY